MTRKTDAVIIIALPKSAIQIYQVFTSENLGKKSWEKGNKFLVKRSHLSPGEFFPGEALKERNDTLIPKVVEIFLHVYWMGTTQAQLWAYEDGAGYFIQC